MPPKSEARTVRA
uniref:Uncharacterized protein n=1 Tax=Anopheles arabiensis TaxID=7173 RepID=A0A182HVY9_ANOAR